MSDKQKRMFWNIIKGIGIISIVIGHSCPNLVKFVYFYHLAIFFFVGGALYNEKKYGNDPYLNFATKIKNNWGKYVLFSIFFTLIHNFLFKHGMIISNAYTFKDILTSCLNTLLFFGTETMSGALWFVPVFILSSGLFGTIIYICIKVSKYLKEDNNIELKNNLIFLFTILCAVLGLYLNTRNINLMLHIQTTFLVIPFFTFGYFFNKEPDKVTEKLNLLVFTISLIFLLIIFFKTNISFDLSSNKVGNPYLFYIISFAGIYCCLYIAKIVLKLRYSSKLLNTIGTYSYEIMALHFVVFKVIDYIYARINGINDYMIYGKFPYAFKNLSLIYVIFGVGIPVLLFLIFDKVKDIYKEHSSKIRQVLKNILNNIHNFLCSKAFIYILIFLSIIAFGYPIIKLGIMHNDELMSRYWSSQGFEVFYKHYFVEQFQKGRALSSVIIPFSMYLGFVGQGTYMFKIGQIASIILVLYLFCRLLKKIFQDKNISLLYFALFISFLPITFEPTVPSVFVTFYNISLCLLIISFSLFYDYLKSSKKSKLIWSMVLFFITETTYEAFITYVIVYLLLALYEKGYKNIKKNLKCFIWPILAAFLYLILYIVSAKVFPSNYDGNQINGINLLNSLKIIFTLTKNVIPGSYLISDKYQWLYTYYYNLNLKNVLVIIISVLIFISLIFIGVTDNTREEKYSTKALLKIIILGISLMILPTLPISVASMYQNSEILNNLVALPVSFFSYFGSILILSYAIEYIVKKNQTSKFLIIILLGFSIFGVQLLNNVVSKEANSNFRRLEEIEEFVSSKDLLQGLENSAIYSPDLFITKNTLVIHKTYWNEFAALKGININFINAAGDNNDIKLSYDDNLKIFILSKNNLYYLITKNIDMTSYILEDKDKIEFELAKKDGNFIEKNGWNVYYYSVKSDNKAVKCEVQLNKSELFNKCKEMQ